MFKLIRLSAVVAVLSAMSFTASANSESLDELKELGSIIGESASKAKLQDSCAKIVEQYAKDKSLEIPAECRDKVEGLVKDLSQNKQVKAEVSALAEKLF